MFNASVLTFQEFVMREELPLSTIQSAILEFLRGRDDAVLFGTQAVNAYVDEPRMTQGIDLLAVKAKELAEELREYFSDKFHIAVRVRELRKRGDFRLFQLRKPRNRHLVDLRSVRSLPAAQRVEQILVMQPAELIALKVIAYQKRRGSPKSGTDWRDLAMLLLAFPELKSDSGAVANRLQAEG